MRARPGAIGGEPPGDTDGRPDRRPKEKGRNPGGENDGARMWAMARNGDMVSPPPFAGRALLTIIGLAARPEPLLTVPSLLRAMPTRSGVAEEEACHDKGVLYGCDARAY